MCQTGGPRCPDHPHASQRRARARKVQTAFRAELSEHLKERGVSPYLAKGVSVSGIAPLARASGLEPKHIFSAAGGEGAVPGTANPRLTEKDRDIIAAATRAYTPDPDFIREHVVKSEDALAELGQRVQAHRVTSSRVSARRAELAEALDSGDPYRVHSARAAFKDAALDSVITEKELREHTDGLMDDIAAATRDAEFVPAYQGPLIADANPDTDADPAGITPLRAMGLSSKRGTDGSLKPMWGDAQERANRAAGNRPLPSTDHRATQYLLAEMDRDLSERFGGRVHEVGALVGSREKNAFVDAVVMRGGEPAAVVIVADPANGDAWDGGPSPELRARALYAAHVAGLRGAAVAAMVDGSPRTFEMTVDDTVDGSPNGKRIADVVDKIDANRKRMVEFSEEPEPDHYGGRLRGQISDRDKREFAEAESNLAALLHGELTPFEVKKELARRRGVEKMSADDAVRSMIRDHWSRASMGTLAGVDGETAGITNDQRSFDPEYADWIETGIVTYGPDGKKRDRFERLHGADQRILSTNGTGAEHIHHISPEMIEGKPRFETEGEREAVRAELLKGDVLVAHNAFFERKHLHAAIPAFEGQRPWLDTQWLAKHFMPESGSKAGRSGLRLQHLVEDLGGEYTNAHRAAEDAEMMMEAAEKLFATPNWWERKD